MLCSHAHAVGQTAPSSQGTPCRRCEGLLLFIELDVERLLAAVGGIRLMFQVWHTRSVATGGFGGVHVSGWAWQELRRGIFRVSGFQRRDGSSRMCFKETICIIVSFSWRIAPNGAEMENWR